jgi:hypothetical protein
VRTPPDNSATVSGLSGPGNRARFEAALAARPVDRPVYAAYDWFVQHRPAVDWPGLFARGLGQICHATVTKHRRPHVQVLQSTSSDAQGLQRRDVRWITDIGELHEWHRGEWRQEYLIKRPEDYRVLARALSDVAVSPALEEFQQSEAAAGDNGITLAVPEIRRTAFQQIQIDFAGLERFSLDLADRQPALLNLIELMNDLAYRDFGVISRLPVRHVKLWENLSIETMGPGLYRHHLVPVYERILETLGGGQRLHVHYDGKLRLIAEDIRRLGLDGLDSLTPPPEGDLSVAEARGLWPEKFLWLHPPLGWFHLEEGRLLANVRRMIADAGPTRYCLMISEEVPNDWRGAVFRILDMLAVETR